MQLVGRHVTRITPTEFKQASFTFYRARLLLSEALGMTFAAKTFFVSKFVNS